MHRRPDRDGSASLELALMMPFLLLILLGILEFGMVFFVRGTMLHSTRDAARHYAVRDFTRQECMDLAIDGMDHINAEFTVDASAADASSGDRWIELSVPADQISLADPLNLFSDGQVITIRTTMRRED